ESAVRLRRDRSSDAPPRQKHEEINRPPAEHQQDDRRARDGNGAARHFLHCFFECGEVLIPVRGYTLLRRHLVPLQRVRDGNNSAKVLVFQARATKLLGQLCADQSFWNSLRSIDSATALRPASLPCRKSPMWKPSRIVSGSAGSAKAVSNRTMPSNAPPLRIHSLIRCRAASPSSDQ